MTLSQSHPSEIYEVRRWFEMYGLRDHRMNVGCGPHYASGWCNIDVHYGDGVRPDILVRPNTTLPVANGFLTRVYAGHVLEHVAWDACVEFLVDIHRALCVGGELMVVGPDLKRTLDLWKQDQLDWHMVDAVWESDATFMVDPGTQSWSGARHSWNCTEDRVIRLLKAAQFKEIQVCNIVDESAGDLKDWPVVAYTNWQFAVKAIA